MARRPGRMAGRGDRAAARTNAELAEQELQVLLQTTIDWEEIRPEITDQETYDALIAAVQAATAQNENIAQLKDRLAALGSGGAALVKKVISLVP